MLNSFVANYLVRLQVGTHVTASLMSRLPVPRVSRESPHFERLSRAWRPSGLRPLMQPRMRDCKPAQRGCMA